MATWPRAPGWELRSVDVGLAPNHASHFSNRITKKVNRANSVKIKIICSYFHKDDNLDKFCAGVPITAQDYFYYKLVFVLQIVIPSKKRGKFVEYDQYCVVDDDDEEDEDYEDEDEEEDEVTDEEEATKQTQKNQDNMKSVSPLCLGSQVKLLIPDLLKG